MAVGVFGREAFVVGASVAALVVEEEVLRALERVVIALRLCPVMTASPSFQTTTLGGT